MKPRASANFCHWPKLTSTPSGQVRPSCVSSPAGSRSTTSPAPARSTAAPTAGAARIAETNMFQAKALSEPNWYGRVRILRESRRVILQPGEPARTVEPDAAQETDLAHRRADVRGEA